MMSTTRTTRPSRQKPNTTQHAQNSKSDGQLSNMKNQPTAEQMRIAQMTSGCDEDPDIKKKINQIIELTGRTTDDALVALHDCDYDLNGAVEQLLENENDLGEWKEAGKKKKSQLISKLNSTPVIDTKDGKTDRDRSSDCLNERGGEWAPRGRRGDSRAPPRFRGRGRDRDRDRENDENERNRIDSSDRGFERGRGRGRGGRGIGRGGRGRGRGGSSGVGGALTPTSTNFDSTTFEKGPQIDTWTNDTAEKPTEKDEIGAWSDVVSEDWATEDWTGTLNESKVFTASTTKPPERNGGFNNDAGGATDTMFSQLEPSIETQVFTGASTVSPIMNHSGDTYHHADTHSSLQLDQTGTTQNSFGGNSVGHRVDLCEIFAKTAEASSQEQEFMQAFSKAVTESVAVTQAELMSQYTREATETIKNAVGIGSQSRSPTQHECERTSPQQRQQQAGMMPQRSTRVQRTKLPPPSKIPASAVEMPGAMNYRVDVQFGNWDAPAEPSFGFGVEPQSSGVTVVGNNNYNSGNHLHNLTSSVDPSMSPSDRISDMSVTTTSLDNMPQSSAPVSQSGMFQAGMAGTGMAGTTPPKEYSQSSTMHTEQLSSHESFPSSQQSDSTAYSSQRQAQSAGPLSGGKSTSPMSYGGSSGYTSAYQSSYKSAPMTTSSNTYASHPGGGLPSLSPNNLQSKSQYSTGSYQTSSPFPAQSEASSTANTGQLYPNEASSYQSQTSASSYPNHTPAAFSSSSGYQHQGAAAYANQSASSYQNQSSAYQRDTSSYHSDAQPSNLAYTAGSQSNSAYQSDAATGYPSGNQTSGSTYQRDTQSQYNAAHQAAVAAAYNASHPTSNSTMSSSDKLSDSLNKMAVNDLGVDHASSASASLTTTTTTTSSSMASGNVSEASSLGLTTSSSSLSTSAVSSTTSTIKSSLPLTKAPPNLPPGVPPVMGHNYMIGQPGAMPFAAFNLLPQHKVYTYEEIQLLQQRLTGVPGYYDMPLQPPTTLTAGRDHTGLAAVPPYTIGDAGKLGRVDAQSPVSAQTSQQTSSQQQQQQHQQQQQQQQQQQPFLNPTIPPGYYNYYTPGGLPGGLLHGGYSYQPTLFQVPSVTNATHGGTSAAPQFQKPGLYGSHGYGAGYDDLTGQAGDFSKGYSSGVSQGQSKASGVGPLSSSTQDIGGAGSGYNKAHSQQYDKQGFHAGTPPPFNMPLATGSQAGPLGAPTGYGAPYMPMVPHQPHSQMLHHHMQQESAGGTRPNSQQSTTQPKPGVAKSYNTGYWGGN